MNNYLISSDNFISLFITIYQSKFLMVNRGKNMMGMACSFKESELTDFIYYSKKDPRYSEFLKCFNIDRGVLIDLVLAINKAYDKHLITTIQGDVVYVSKFYTANILSFDSSMVLLMENFIDDFNKYLDNSEEYTSLVETELLELTDNSRNIFDLKRKLIWR